MNPVRQALYETLTGDSDLTSLLSAETAVYYRKAPRTAQPPFVVFAEQSPGTDTWTFDGPSLLDELWFVKGIDREPSTSVVEEIEQAIATVLNGASIPLDEGALLDIRRTGRVAYPEDDGAETWNHAGGIYRLQIQNP